MTWIKNKKWYLLGIALSYLAFQLIFSLINGPERYFSFLWFILIIEFLAIILFPDKKAIRLIKYLGYAVLIIPFSIVYLFGFVLPILEALLLSFIVIAIIFNTLFFALKYTPSLLLGIDLNIETLI